MELRWVSISSCTAGAGGGIFDLAPFELYQVTIDDCHAINGGAIFAFGNLELTFSTLRGCTASVSGGGLISYASTQMEGVVIESCAATDGAGGGIEVYNFATMDLTEVTMRNNSASTQGAAINLGTGARLQSVVLHLDHWCRGSTGDTVSIINGLLNDPVTGASTSAYLFDTHLNTFGCEGAWASSNASATADRRQLQTAAPQPLVGVNHNRCSDLTYTDLQGNVQPVCGANAVCSDRPIVEGSPITTPHCSCAAGSYPRPEIPGGVALLSATQLVTRPFDAGCVTPRRGEDVSVYTEQLVVQLRKRENELPQLLSNLTLRIIGTDGVAAFWRISNPTVGWLRPDLTPALNGVVPPSTTLAEISIPLGFSASGLRESTDPYTTTVYTDVRAVEYTAFQTPTLLYVTSDTVASRSSWGPPTDGRCVSLEAQRENQVRDASWPKLRIGSGSGLVFQACDLDGLVVQHQLPSEHDTRRFEVTPTLVASPFQNHPFTTTLSSELATVVYASGGAYSVRLDVTTPGNYSLNLTLGSELVGLPLRLIVECPLREAPILSGSTCGCAPGLEPLGAGQCELCPEGTAKSIAANAACGLCHPGFYAESLGQAECTPCEAGRFAEAAGRTACTACPAGTSTHGLTGQDSCSDCGPGTYALGNEGSCSLCPAGTFNNEFGQAGCDACWVSKYSGPGQAECDECGLRDDTQQTAEDTGNPEAANGIDCTGGLVVGTLEGYWSRRPLTYSNTNETRTWGCLVAGACLGGLNSTCAEGHTGIACIKCVDGWYTAKYGKELCVPIPGWEPGQSKAMLYVVYILGFFCVCGASFAATALCFRLSRNEAEDDVTPPWEAGGIDEHALLLKGHESLQPEKSTVEKSRKGIAAFGESTKDLQRSDAHKFLTAPKETFDEPSAEPTHVWIMHEVDGPYARPLVQAPTVEPTLKATLGKWKTGFGKSKVRFNADGAEAVERVEAQGAESMDNLAAPLAEEAPTKLGRSSNTPFCKMLATTLRKFSMRVQVEPDDMEVRVLSLRLCGTPHSPPPFGLAQ